MNIGHTIRLTPAEVQQLILDRAIEIAKAKKIPLPVDERDFQNRAEAHFVNDNQAVPAFAFDGVVVTWEDA